MAEFEHFKPYEGKMPYIFISYAHADQDSVLPIVQDLHEHGYRLWYDEGIEVGSEWQECIASHLADAYLVIAFISNSYIASDNCRREMNFALTKRIKVINVFLTETALTPGMEMQIGSIFALMKYSFPSDEVFYQKLYSAPLLNSEDLSPRESVPAAVSKDGKKGRDRKKDRARPEKKQKQDAPKKKKLRKILTLVVTVLVLGLLIAGTLVAYFTGFLERLMTETKTVTPLDAQITAEFTQPIFEAAAREYTGISSGDITVGDLKGMTALYICGDKYWLNEPRSTMPALAMGETQVNITDWQGETVTVAPGGVNGLSDLQYFTSLRTLWLQFQSLNSLETLPVCGIENLDISHCRVSSLQGISNLPELRSLRADGTSLTELGDLNCCLKLESASFVGGSVSDYTVFRPLNKIRTIAFSNSSTGDIDQVLDHSSLRSVALYNCNLSGRFFNKFDNEDIITDLYLDNCKLDNLAGISEFANLSELTLYQCGGISDYQELAGLPGLKTVNADKAAAAELKNIKAAFEVKILP